MSKGLPEGLTRQELAEITAHSSLYLRRLRRVQLMLSLLALVAFGGLVGALPLVLFLAPGLQRVDVLGLRLPLLFMLAPFPLLVAIAWLYQRRADELDATFHDLISEEDS